MPAISIIIPMYNASGYIRTMLDSIVSQPYRDWEAVVIDDGSTDDSLSICEGYARKDPRIFVYHKENGGVSSARNVGIEKAKGEWLYFCDADDELLSNAFSVFENKRSACEEVLLNAGYIVVDDAGRQLRRTPDHAPETIGAEEMIKRLIFPGEFIYQGYLWCKLFRSDLVRKNNMSFDTSIFFNEDRLFVVQYLCRSKGTVWYSTVPMYRYYERESGAMGSLKRGFNPKFKTDVKAFIKMIQEVKHASCSKALVAMCKEGAFESFLQIRGMAVKYGYDMDEITDLKHDLLKSTGLCAYLCYLPHYVLKRVCNKVLRMLSFGRFLHSE